MKRAMALIFLLLSFSGFAQIQGEDEVYLNTERIDAKFNGGGMEKFSAFVKKEFDYSKITQAGKMVAAFTVDVDGSVKNIKLVEMIDMESAKEMIRVLSKCPKWQPATKQGKPVSVEIKYPMVFTHKKR